MRNPKRLWLSTRQLKQHELYKAVRQRTWNADTWEALYSRLTERINEQGKKLQKMAIFPGILFLLSYSVDFQAGEIGKFFGIPVAIPISFALFIASLWCLYFAVLTQSTLVVLLVRAQISGKLYLKGKDTVFSEFLDGKDEFATVFPFFVGSFFKTSKLLMFFQLLILFFAFFVVFVLVVPVVFFLANLQITMLSENIGIVEKTALVFGLAALSATVLFPLLFNIPSLVKKNQYQIRYGLLCRVSDLSPHPQTHIWQLDEDGT